MTDPLSRRTFLLLTGQAVAAATILSACAAQPSGTKPSAVQIWRSFANAEQEEYFKTNFIEAYNQVAGLKAELTVQQTTTIDRMIQTALAAGKGPDIVESTGPAMASSYANAGYLAELEGYVDAFGWADKLQPWALGAGLVDGKLYSIPRAYSSLTMLYNPETFDSNGWSLPTTRDELEAICEDAESKGIMPIAAGNADYQGATEWHISVFLNHVAGPEAVYRALTSEIKWTDPAIVESIQLLADYIGRGWYGGGAQDYFTNTEASMFTKLASGDAALLISGSWAMSGAAPYFGEAAGNDATWDWASIPALNDGVPQGLVGLGVGGTYGINAASAVPDETAELIDFLVTDPVRQATALAEVGLSPAPALISDSDFPSSVDERVRRFYGAFSAAEWVGYTSWTYLPPKTNSYLYTEMEKVIVGDLSAADYCEGLQDQFAAEYAEGIVPVPPVPNATVAA